VKIFGLSRVNSETHKLFIANRTHSIYASFGGNIYLFVIQIGRLGISWEARDLDA
jgi:hypothetical protein